MGAGKQDYIYGYSSWIEDEILTRGYKLSPMQQMKGIRMTLDLETWNPRFDVFVRRAGRSTEDRVANDVRRGFESTLRMAAGTKIFEAKQTYCSSANWSIAYTRMYDYFEMTLTYVGAASDEYDYIYGYVGTPIVVGSNPARPARVDLLENNVVLDSQAFYAYNVGSVAAIEGSAFALHGMLPIYRDYRVTVGGVDTAGSIWVYIYRGVPTITVEHSRRQRIFGAEEVLWSEGSAPAELNGRGHNDYAWRVGAGLGSGVILGGTERYPHVYRLTKRGEFVQARVSNIRGYSALHGVALHGQVGRRGKGDRAG
jgi:hypothetical protein